jgi:two-component system response regulator YesN
VKRMARYKAMLVDDEVEIREGIKHAVNWEEIGLDLVATAENGQEALELATSLNPDIVMTDIKMPFMDGLELGKLLRASMPEIKLVIFSGFDEFDYAQKAIQIKALEYILKPIDAQELTSLLQKILVQLDNEFIEKYTIEQLQTRYENSLPILREQFYIRLLNTNVSSSWVKEQIEIHDIEISGNCWSVSLLQLNSEVLPEQHSPMFTGGKELLIVIFSFRVFYRKNG